MKWLNKVQLIGYLSEDPRIYLQPSGYYYARLRVATNTSYSKKGIRGITYWHTVTMWGKKTAWLQTNFIKGSHIMVEGKITYGSYLDKEGQTRQVTEIKAENLINLDR